MEHRAEQADGDPAMTELFHAAIGGLDAAGKKVKAIASNGPGEQRAFGEQGALAETAQAQELLAVEEQEHPGGGTSGEWAQKGACTLGEIVPQREEIVEKTAMEADDAGGDQVEAALSDGFHGAAKKRPVEFALRPGTVGELDIGIEKKDVRRGGEGGPRISSGGGRFQSAPDHLNCQPVFVDGDRVLQCRGASMRGVAIWASGFADAVH